MADSQLSAQPPRTTRRGLVGPFSGRQLGVTALVLVVAAAALFLATRPLGRVGGDSNPAPLPTAYIVGAKPAEGLEAGQAAPELAVQRADGTTFQLTDLDGVPVRLADLRGRLVWLNFWASWCPPCQSETPILRSMDEQYASKGLSIIGISVQETTPDDVRRYVQRYGLGYTVAFDVSADVFHRYKVYALPTQFFIGPDGVIREVLNGPLDEASAKARVEAWLAAG